MLATTPGTHRIAPIEKEFLGQWFHFTSYVREASGGRTCSAQATWRFRHTETCLLRPELFSGLA